MPNTKEDSRRQKALDERKTYLKDHVKKAGRAYVNLTGKLNVDQLSNDTQKNQQKIDFLLEHGDIIEEFIALYPESDYGSVDTHVIGIVVDAYKKYIWDRGAMATDAATVAQSMEAPLGGLAASVKASDGRAEDQEDSVGMDRTVSPGQLSGIRDIARWMYRNSDDTGALSLGDSQERFVRQILQLPARVKLLMYYLVENKRRHNPDGMDIMQSQMNYVPSLDAFKDQMIATKWKFWKRVDGSYVYWNKLEEALAFARPCMGILAGYGALGPMDSLDREMDTQSTENDDTQVETELSQNADPDIQEAVRKGRERDEALRNLLELTGIHRAMLMEKEQGMGVSDDQVALSALTIEAAFKNLLEKDASMVARPEEAFGTPGREKAQSYVSTGASAVGAGGSLNKVGTAADFINKFVTWKLSQTDLVNLNFSSGIFTTTAGVTSFASALIGIYNVSKGAGAMPAAELASRIMDIVISFSSIAGTVTKGAYGIKNAAIVGAAALEGAGKAALDHASKASGGAAAVTGMLNLGAGFLKAAKADDELSTARDARKELDAMDLSEADKARVEALTGLNERVNDSRKSSGAIQAASGFMQMMGGIFTASGAAAIVGTIFSTLGSALSLAVSVKEYFERKNNMDMTIDTYIKMDDLWTLVSSGLIRNGRERSDVLAREKQIRVQIRQEATATLGFASKESFYRHITRAYAKFLYDHAFYKDEDHTQAITAAEAAGGENAYAKMLRGFGVRPIYPKESDGIPGPDIDSIAKKMGI